MKTEEIVLLAKQGDEDAFFFLVSTEKERLYRIAIAYLKNETEALEAIQEVTCRAYENLEKPEGTIKTWLTKALVLLRVYICKDRSEDYA